MLSNIIQYLKGEKMNFKITQ